MDMIIKDGEEVVYVLKRIAVDYDQVSILASGYRSCNVIAAESSRSVCGSGDDGIHLAHPAAIYESVDLSDSCDAIRRGIGVEAV